MDYWVIIEKADDGSFSAYVPDLPGCVSCGDTMEDAKQLIAEAIQLHTNELRSRGHVVPTPVSQAALIHAA